MPTVTKDPPITIPPPTFDIRGLTQQEAQVLYRICETATADGILLNLFAEMERVGLGKDNPFRVKSAVVVHRPQQR